MAEETDLIERSGRGQRTSRSKVTKISPASETSLVSTHAPIVCRPKRLRLSIPAPAVHRDRRARRHAGSSSESVNVSVSHMVLLAGTQLWRHQVGILFVDRLHHHQQMAVARGHVLKRKGQLMRRVVIPDERSRLIQP